MNKLAGGRLGHNFGGQRSPNAQFDRGRSLWEWLPGRDCCELDPKFELGRLVTEATSASATGRSESRPRRQPPLLAVASGRLRVGSRQRLVASSLAGRRSNSTQRAPPCSRLCCPNRDSDVYGWASANSRLHTPMHGITHGVCWRSTAYYCYPYEVLLSWPLCSPYTCARSTCGVTTAAGPRAPRGGRTRTVLWPRSAGARTHLHGVRTLAMHDERAVRTYRSTGPAPLQLAQLLPVCKSLGSRIELHAQVRSQFHARGLRM